MWWKSMEDSSSTRKITDSRHHSLSSSSLTHPHLSPVLLISPAIAHHMMSYKTTPTDDDDGWFSVVSQVDYKKFIQWSSLLWPHPSETGSNSPVTRTLINTFLYIFIYLQVSCKLQLQASWLGAMWMRNQLVPPGFLGPGYWEIGSYAAGKREG